MLSLFSVMNLFWWNTAPNDSSVWDFMIFFCNSVHSFRGDFVSRKGNHFVETLFVMPSRFSCHAMAFWWFPVEILFEKKKTSRRKQATGWRFSTSETRRCFKNAPSNEPLGQFIIPFLNDLPDGHGHWWWGGRVIGWRFSRSVISSEIRLKRRGMKRISCRFSRRVG